MKVSRQKKLNFYSSKKHPSKKRPWKLWAAGVIFVLIVGGAVYFLAFSPFFKIKEIKIQGAQTIDQERIIFLAKDLAAKKWLEIWPQDSLVFFPGAALSRKISGEFAQISRAEVKKIFFRMLEIKIEERQPMAVWCQNETVKEPLVAENIATSTPVEKKEVLPQGDQCFFIDKEGIIFRESPKISSSFFPLIFGAAGQSFFLRQQSLASSTLEFARQAKKNVGKEGVEISFFLENERQKELEAFTFLGWKIYFNLERSAQNQIRIIQTLFREGLKDRQGNLEYIDLRIPNRVYYK